MFIPISIVKYHYGILLQASKFLQAIEPIARPAHKKRQPDSLHQVAQIPLITMDFLARRQRKRLFCHIRLAGVT